MRKSFRSAAIQRAEEENKDPFDEKQVYLMSIHFAARYSIRLRTVDWDLVVIDEAHKLRNVFRKKNKMAQSIKWALQPFKKILLTATPIQNSLLELFGLAMLIDEHYFGDVDSFRRQFINTAGGIDELRRRITVFCHRTRREQVTEYIRYTRRRSITTPFYPTDEEQRLYDRITEFIHRKDSYSIPSEQRHLMILVLRKILASSRIATAGERQKTMLGCLLDPARHFGSERDPAAFIREESLDDDLLEAYDELPEESEEAGNRSRFIWIKRSKNCKALSIWLKRFLWIPNPSLVKALDIAFHELEQMGARRKVVVFTESRRTQEHLAALLRSRGFRDTVVTFNGTNTDPASQQTQLVWLDKNRDTGKSSGSKAVDMRWALAARFPRKRRNIYCH
ncbi:MAG: SNF2-related protein [candidate division KSB1 bacterium]|nr:SNF2-related protein [candidate division KSB1 bacterium]